MAARTRYGDHRGRIVAVLRRAAGFASGRDAARRFGWKAATYRAHEAGYRPMRDEQYRDYLKAFGATAAEVALASHVAENPDRRHHRSAAAEIAERRAAQNHEPSPQHSWLRLKAARLACGFATVPAAASRYRWPDQTLYSHERCAAMNSASVARYAAAFSVSEAWLIDGKGISGLPPEIDAIVRQEDSAGGRAQSLEYLILPLSDPARARSRDEVEAMLATRAANKRVGVTVDEVTVISRVAALKLARMKAPRLLQTLPQLGRWPLPAGYVGERFGCLPGSLVMVASDGSTGDRTALGDLFLVDWTGTAAFSRREVLCFDAEGMIRILSRNLALEGYLALGAILMKLIH